MGSIAVRCDQVLVHSQEDHLLLCLQGPLATSHDDVLGEVLLQAIIVSSRWQKFAQDECRVLAPRIKQTEKLMKRCFTYMNTSINRLYHITMVLGDLDNSSIQLLDQLDVES